MKNCCAPVPCEQKKLLKLITCLYENYVLNQTPSTDAYFLNPTSNGYDSMIEELNAISTLVNNYLNTEKIFVNSDNENIASFGLWSANALSLVAYDSYDVSGNTFINAVNGDINMDGNINHVGILKPVQKLNLDDCITKAYQVVPLTLDNGTNVKTQASLVERVGCCGVSNLGFLGLTLSLPIANAPFNSCSVPICK